MSCLCGACIVMKLTSQGYGQAPAGKLFEMHTYDEDWILISYYIRFATSFAYVRSIGEFDALGAVSRIAQWAATSHSPSIQASTDFNAHVTPWVSFHTVKTCLQCVTDAGYKGKRAGWILDKELHQLNLPLRGDLESFGMIFNGRTPCFVL